MSSIKSMQTLKGVFDVPKTNYRRDFLRENKLSLRELQRVTNRKQSTQHQEQQQKHPQQQKQLQQQQQFYAERRSASQQRGIRQHEQQQQSTINRNSQKQQQQQRSLSQQRFVDSGLCQRSQPPLNCQSCCGSSVRYAPSAASKTSTLCNKEIQTDDINDEDFLYKALKKCASHDFVNAAATTESAKHSENVVERQTCSDPNVSMSNQIKHGLNGLYDIQDSRSYNEVAQQNAPDDVHVQMPEYRTKDDFSANEQLNDEVQTVRSDISNISRRQVDTNINRGYSDLNKQFETLNMEQQNDQLSQEPLSARSRRTTYSTQSINDGSSNKLMTKRSTGSIHKLGSRDDVRLPRYLEREKREKEQQLMHKMERDPNCPLDHYTLTEDERITALTLAEKKFKTLVNELNRMPMTCETLRIRMRKAEIEKELTHLEADIRIFSKPKVYLKQD